MTETLTETSTETSKIRKVYTACQGWGCHERCILTSYTDGKNIIRVEKAEIPESLVQDNYVGNLRSRNGICQKGIVSNRIPFSDVRLTHPLKRVGEIGEGRWEQISWDQALSEITAKMEEIAEKYGPQSIMIGNANPCCMPLNSSALISLLSFRFMFLYGASQFECEAVDAAAVKLPHLQFGDGLGNLIMSNSQKIAEANFIIIWGGNPIGQTRGNYTTRTFLDAIERGVRVVDIGINYDPTAAKCNQFIQVKPGTDGPLALAMANLIITEGLVDDDYMNSRTVAPFLVRDDNGRYLREPDFIEGGDPEKYLFWDSVTSGPISMGKSYYEFGEFRPVIDAVVEVSGIPCRTAYARLKERLADWTPERQEPITGVPAQVVRDLTREYISSSPSIIFNNCGLRYYNGLSSERAISLLTLLSGNLGKPGGAMLCCPCSGGWPVSLNELSVIFPKGIRDEMVPKVKIVDLEMLLESFRDSSKQQYKALIWAFSNPGLNWPNRKMWLEEVYPNLELSVAFDFRMTETCEFSDYVLPDVTTFEREEIVASSGDCMVLLEAAIEPVGESRWQYDVWCEIGQRMGFGEYFDKDYEGWNRLRLENLRDPSVVNVSPPITYERLKQEKIIPLETPKKVIDYYLDLPTLTPSGRAEFYLEDYVDIGAELVEYRPALIHDQQAREEYPLHLFVGRSRFFMQGQFREVPELRTLAGNGPQATMNPDDAVARGIREGDLIEVFNHRGSVVVPVTFSTVTQPGSVSVLYAWSNHEYHLSDPPTVLQATMNANESRDPIAIRLADIKRAESLAAGRPLPITFEAGYGSNDTLWDAYCEVRPYIKEEEG
ncbi:MAG: molybdopterin-dependent oxidoreductase [Coriobacteriales bacterium]|jgi:molybdopterin-containing oxidoreductase family molybdopterin binding subunit|nr:molybdopterin-dependent oxidoreductase [Coriobacteriales bacterium]